MMIPLDSPVYAPLPAPMVVSVYFEDGRRRHYTSLADAVIDKAICGMLVRNSETKVVTVCTIPCENMISGRCITHGGYTKVPKERKRRTPYAA